MIKIGILGFILVKGLLVSGYFGFIHGKPKRISVKKFSEAKQDLAAQFNSFALAHPSDTMSQLIADLEWILRNDYRKDIRVKRILHQDLKNLMDMAHLRDTLQSYDTLIETKVQDALETIVTRTTAIRYSNDAAVKEKVLMLGEIIDDNER